MILPQIPHSTDSTKNPHSFINFIALIVGIKYFLSQVISLPDHNF